MQEVLAAGELPYHVKGPNSRGGLLKKAVGYENARGRATEYLKLLQQSLAEGFSVQDGSDRHRCATLLEYAQEAFHILFIQCFLLENLLQFQLYIHKTD